MPISCDEKMNTSRRYDFSFQQQNAKTMTTNNGNDEETQDGGGKTPKKDRKLALLNGYAFYRVVGCVAYIFSVQN